MRLASTARFLAIGIALAAGQASAGAEEDFIKDKISSMDAKVQISNVEKSTIEGLYLVELSDGDHLFVTKDGRQFIQGNLYAREESGKVLNLSERRRQAAAAKELAAVPLTDMVIYPAVDKKASITVFSDPSCPYCKLLHKSIPELNKQGIEVRYMAFPRMGLGSDGHADMASAWCSKYPQTAITKLFNGESIPEVQCKNPVADEFLLGQKIGVQGTPTIFLENGKKMVGVQSPEQLADELGLKK